MIPAGTLRHDRSSGARRGARANAGATQQQEDVMVEHC